MPPTYPEIAANAAHVLVGVAMALLDRQIAAQATAFEREGGFTERLYRTRTQRRRGLRAALYEGPDPARSADCCPAW